MKKRKKVQPDSIVLGVSGEALLVLGLILALAGKPQWNGILTILMGLFGVFLIVWGFALSKKRKEEGQSTLTTVLLVMGVLALLIGITGYLSILNTMVLGIAAAVIGVASDIVLAIVAKAEKEPKNTN